MKVSALFALAALGALPLAGCTEGDSEIGKPINLPPSARRASVTVASALPMTLPTPPVPPPPHADDDKPLNGSELGHAEVELPGLLGELWYPDAEISCHSRRGAGQWSSVTLLAPSDEKIRGVLDYYELRFPGGERKNNEYVAETTRPGDDAPTRLHIFRATTGGDAGKILIRFQS